MMLSVVLTLRREGYLKMSQNEVFSVKQTQKIIGFGKTKIYQLLNSGELPAKKAGRKTLILKRDIDKFLESLESYPTHDGGYDV